MTIKLSTLPPGAEREMLRAAWQFDGLEVPREDWSIAERLSSRGLVTLSDPRGPGGSWIRVTPVEDVDEG